MKTSIKLFALLFAAQVLPWASQSALAQPITAAQREDRADGLKLQGDYRLASFPLLSLFSRKQPAHSAEVVTETIKTLADGNQIKNKQTYARYRDENGRMKMAYKTADGKERIFIADPAAKLAYLIRPNRKDVLRLSGDASPLRAPTDRPLVSKAPDWSKVVRTSLGVKEFDGIKAAGLLNETIYPAGARGNEKEMVETMETWHSSELSDTVYMRSYSPRDGERITRVENIRLGEVPDTAFALPADYAIRDIAFQAGQEAQPEQ
jgi:hypothetical protein